MSQRPAQELSINIDTVARFGNVMLAASKPAVNLETNEGYEAQGEGKHQIANVTLTTTGQVRFPVGLGM